MKCPALFTAALFSPAGELLEFCIAGFFQVYALWISVDRVVSAVGTRIYGVGGMARWDRVMDAGDKERVRRDLPDSNAAARRRGCRSTSDFESRCRPPRLVPNHHVGLRGVPGTPSLALAASLYANSR